MRSASNHGAAKDREHRLAIGWTLAGDYIVDHTGLDVSDRNDVDEQIKALMLRLL